MLPSHFPIWQVKYKEDLDWVKGIGCYVWDTPLLKQAEHNKALYSEVKHFSLGFKSSLFINCQFVKTYGP